jgi:hypothetical protein
MKERGRERIEKGGLVEKGKEARVLGKMPFFLLWLASKTEREGGRAGGRPAGVPAGAPVLVGDRRMEGNGDSSIGQTASPPT